MYLLLCFVLTNTALHSLTDSADLMWIYLKKQYDI